MSLLLDHGKDALMCVMKKHFYKFSARLMSMNSASIALQNRVPSRHITYRLISTTHLFDWDALPFRTDIQKSVNSTLALPCLTTDTPGSTNT